MPTNLKNFPDKLKHSKYGSPHTVDHIAKRFDETTKRLFRDKRDPQFIPFGSPLDKDLLVGIRSGQLKLTGEEVAGFFEPSIKGENSLIIRSEILNQPQQLWSRPSRPRSKPRPAQLRYSL